MKRFFAFFLFVLVVCAVYAQKLDTLYYDNVWKGVDSPVFASYFRVISSDNTSKTENTEISKRFRDYYITGEIYADGRYLSIDRNDDAHSVFDGDVVSYYRSGKILKKISYQDGVACGECSSYYENGQVKLQYTLVNGLTDGQYISYYDDGTKELSCVMRKGVKDGECTTFYKNGLIKEHCIMKNGKMNGLLTKFDAKGETFTQMEMQDGNPYGDYYIVYNNKDGLGGKFHISDNTPMWDTPSVDKKKQFFKDGEAWDFYDENNITIAVKNTVINDYGKWYQQTISITNNSLNPIEFDPDNIKAALRRKDSTMVGLKVFTSDEYIKKVKKSQNWASFWAGLGEGIAAASAGYSSSTTQTNTSYSGNSSSNGNASAYGSGGYAYGSYKGNSSYHGNASTTSHTVTYNGLAAYQAQVIASDRMASFSASQFRERQIKEQEYLKKTTINPGESIAGYVNIRRSFGKGNFLTVYIDVNGIVYEFPWEVEK